MFMAYAKIWFIIGALLLCLTAQTAAVVPPAPTGLKAAPGNGAVGLIWDASSDPSVTLVNIHSTWYQDLAGNSYTSFFDMLTPVNSPATTYLAASLTNGLSYQFSLIAHNLDGDGLETARITAYPAVLPTAPTGITATAATTPPQVQLIWTPVLAQTFPISNYAVYRSVSGEAQALYASTTNTAFVDSGVTTLSAFEDYFYQIAAVDGKGNTGARSSVAHALLTVPSAVAMPTGLSVTAQDGQIKLLWNPVSGADGYQINLLRASTTVESVFYTSAPNSYTAVAYTISLPNNGETYLVSVAALATGALSPRTPMQTVSTLAPMVSGLNVQAGNGYCQLSWNPSMASSVTGYNIYADAVNGTTLVNNVPASSAQFVHVTTATNFYGVRAVIQTVPGAAGPTVTATALGTTALPAAPSGLAVSLGNSRTLALGWNTNYLSDSVTTYHLYALDGPFSGFRNIPVTAGANTTVANLTNGQNYRFFLTAVNANGESAASLTVTAAALAPPVKFTSQANGNAVRFSWNAGDNPSGVAGYQIFSIPENFSSFTLLTITAQTDYLVAPLNNGTYYFNLGAVNGLGQTLPQSYYSTLTVTVSVPPAPPFPIQLTPGDQEIDILWHSVGLSVNTYNIYRTQVSGQYSAPLVTNIPTKNTFYQDVVARPRLNNTQTYFYTLTAVNEAGESSRSAEYSAIPYKPSQLPPDPTVRASHVRRSVSLDWDASRVGSYAIVGYNVYRSQNGGSSFLHLGSSNTPGAPTLEVLPGNSATAFGYFDTDVNYGITYEYRVQTLDSMNHAGTAYNIARVPIDFPNNRLDVWRNAFNPAKGESVPVTLSQVQPGHTWVKIYNLAGQLICTLWEGNVDGQYNPDFPFLLNLTWDGKNGRGDIVASGVYLIHAEGQSRYHQTRKVAVIK
jgi:hypothetical protein